MKIYTKTGDEGTTSLVGGSRVAKTDVRLEAYGTVDELSAFMAYLRDSVMVRRELQGKMQREKEMFLIILERLMVVEALLASEEDTMKKLPVITEEDIYLLEQEIDRMTEQLPKITKFTLPCGDMLVSLSHICRTVCRRAERAALRVQKSYPFSGFAVKYLNRLSDYLYVLGRTIARNVEAEEVLWEPAAK